MKIYREASFVEYPHRAMFVLIKKGEFSEIQINLIEEKLEKDWTKEDSKNFKLYIFDYAIVGNSVSDKISSQMINRPSIMLENTEKEILLADVELLLVFHRYNLFNVINICNPYNYIGD